MREEVEQTAGCLKTVRTEVCGTGATWSDGWWYKVYQTVTYIKVTQVSAREVT